MLATTIRLLFRAAIPALCLLPAIQAQQATEDVLIRTSPPYTAIVNAIQNRGGVVTHQFKYVGGIAARIPADAVSAIAAMVPAGAMSKDSIVELPSDRDAMLSRGLARTGDENNISAVTESALNTAELAALAQAVPNAYLINNSIINAAPLHAGGVTGSGVIVAVIDSGIRPGFPHLSLDGSVIGCEDFVGDALGCSHLENSGHGTFVAGMISANVIFTFATTAALRQAVLAECPACFLNPPTNTQIPMIGTAPASSIYAMRVFGATGGAPSSRIIAAIERVIKLREDFDAGIAGGVNISVVNMSLSGPTVNPGRDLFDLAVDALLAKGMVPVVSASNTGPSSLTLGSPASSASALSVGAASLPHNERILRRAQYGAALGSLYRPFLGTQMAYFSSRGPNADGRLAPDVVTNGFANYGQGFSAPPTGISIGSGTSFAAPSVAGVAALLRQAFPSATSRQVRNAIILSANPALLQDGSTVVDRGAGYVDALAAYNLLAAGNVPDTAPVVGRANSNVKVNIEQNTFLRVRSGTVQESFPALQPGERYDIPYRVAPNTKQVIVTLSSVTPTLPPAQQNQLFGDDVLLTIHSAKTSSIGANGDYNVYTFTSGGTFAINDPETGILRVTVNGDWTNAGMVSGQVSIVSLLEPIPQFTSQGRIANAQTIVIPVNVPQGVASLDFRLGWREDWGSFPVNDVDLFLIAPNGVVNSAGATLSNPEKATIANPLPGTWTAVLIGFEVPSLEDRYEFRATADGKILR
jgi:subtilisin family serine protease